MPHLPYTAPQAIRPGDLVAVLAPSGPPPPGRLREGLDLLSGRYRLRLDPTLSARQGYLAGPDEARADALNKALADPDMRAVFCARGGYGATRLLPSLDPSPLLADPKPIVGFSDVTALLCWALAHGVGSVHGPVITQMPRLSGVDMAQLFQVLEHPEAGGVLAGTPLCPDPRAPGPARSLSGPLVGGNLSLLAALAGTPWALRAKGSILLLEDVSEEPYRLDRMLTQLRQQADPMEPAAVGIGQLLGCRAEGPGAPGAQGAPGTSNAPGAPGAQPTALAVFIERLGAPGRPLVSGLPFGHGDANRAWPVGALAHLDTRRGELRWGPG